MQYSEPANRVVVTSALPYANGEIHLGHIASTYLPSDIFTRYFRFTGKEIYHICASDDFGTPVLINAEREKKTPADYVDFWNKRDYEDFKTLGITFDSFSRTSSPENRQFVQCVFEILSKNGYIYDRNVIQFYCTFDNKFLPDRYVKGKCPYCGAEDQYSDLCERCGRVPEEILGPRCGICGNPPIKKESNHYFFKLSSFSERLKAWLQSNNHLQGDIRNYVVNWINEGLLDWDITRDLSWGIPVPVDNAKGKVFYGWFDNHLCYISTLNAFLQKLGINGKSFWNSAEIYHFIGKDIVYHHYLLLPAVRMGINEEYKLPDYIPCRGHLLLHDQKISKSRNWYIGLRDFVTTFNPDYLRFYLSSITPYSQSDINFDWNAFSDKINNELIAKIGNFINRTLTFVTRSFSGCVPQPGEYDHQDELSLSQIAGIAEDVGSLLSALEIDKSLRRILQFVTHFNQYFQMKQPWARKESSPTTLYVSVNAVKSIAIILTPFIPFSGQKIWYQLGMTNKIHEQSWNSASCITIQPGHLLGKVEPLFVKIDKQTIEAQKKGLGVHNGKYQ